MAHPLQLGLLAAVYVAVAWLGLQMDAVGGFASLVWAPTGVALAALLIGGLRLWPAIWLGALAINAWTGAPLQVAAGIATGNTLEAALAVLILRRVPGFHSSLERLPDLAALVVAGAGLGPLVSASVGVASLTAGGLIAWSEAGGAFRAWWVGDAIGALVVAPLLLTWVTGRGPRGSRPEALALAALLIGLAVLAFSGEAGTSPFQQPYLLFPVLIWAAVRFGPRGAASATFAITATAVAMTALGFGPFVRDRLSESLLYLQVLLAFTAITFLALAALASQLRRRGRELESALVETRIAREQAEKASEVKSDLLGVVSHELRTPLSSLRLQLERLQGQDGGHRDIVDRLIGQCDRLQILIDGLLEYARVQSGRFELEVATFDPVDLLADCLDELRPQADAKRLTLALEPRGSIGSFSSDPRLLRLVVMNLIGNAIKFTDAGRVAIELARIDDGGLAISVADTGRGIPQAEQRRIFEPFEQGEPVRHKHLPGVGLGLALVKELTTALGGSILLDSAPGDGSRFELRLPPLPRAD